MIGEMLFMLRVSAHDFLLRLFKTQLLFPHSDFFAKPRAWNLLLNRLTMSAGLLRIALFVVPVLAYGEPSFPQEPVDMLYREPVEYVQYKDGKISVDFDRIPVTVALNAIQTKTGFEITLPPATESKLLSLRLSGLSLEPAVRSLINSIGLRNFAVLYDEEGYPRRAVVLNARPEVRSTSAADRNADFTTEAIVEPLRAQEGAELQRELERWQELKQEDRTRIEARLKTLPPSEDREQLVTEYGRQLLGIKN